MSETTTQALSVGEKTLEPELVFAGEKDSWRIWRFGEKLYQIEVLRRRNGVSLKNPVRFQIQTPWSMADLDIVKYVIESLKTQYATLIPFVLKNSSVFKVAKYLRRAKKSSPNSLCVYSYYLHDFFNFLGKTPDSILSEVQKVEIAEFNGKLLEIKDVDKIRFEWLKSQIEEYVGFLMAKNVSPSLIRSHIAAIKTWLKVNEVPVPFISFLQNSSFRG